MDYGVFVRIRDGIEALIATSDLIEDEANKIKVGDKVKCEITNLDTVDRRVTATMKNIGAEKTPSIMAPRGDAAARAGTLGDLIKEKLGDKLDETLKR